MHKDGGPAFPVPGASWEKGKGMSLRDYFMAHAPSVSDAWLADHKAKLGKSGARTYSIAAAIAKWRHEYANAMLKQREQS